MELTSLKEPVFPGYVYCPRCVYMGAVSASYGKKLEMGTIADAGYEILQSLKQVHVVLFDLWQCSDPMTHYHMLNKDLPDKEIVSIAENQEEGEGIAYYFRMRTLLRGEDRYTTTSIENNNFYKAAMTTDLPTYSMFTILHPEQHHVIAVDIAFTEKNITLRDKMMKCGIPIQKWPAVVLHPRRGLKLTSPKAGSMIEASYYSNSTRSTPSLALRAFKPEAHSEAFTRAALLDGESKPLCQIVRHRVNWAFIVRLQEVSS